MKVLDGPTLNVYRDMNAKHSMEKEIQAAACWNWALFGVKDKAPQVSHLFGYVDRARATKAASRKAAEDEFRINKDHRYNNLQAGQALRTALDEVRSDYDQVPDDTDTRNGIRDRIFELCIRAAGFTISHAATPYRIVMFEPNDVVMFDHWWLEINGVTVETVTGHSLHAYSDEYLAPAYNLPRNRFAGAVGHLGAARGARVHARYVTQLQDAQVGYLKLIHEM